MMLYDQTAGTKIFIFSLPEADPNYDDSMFTVANLTTTNVRPFTYGSTYTYCWDSIRIYRLFPAIRFCTLSSTGVFQAFVFVACHD